MSDKDIVVFTRQFATMINAGLPLIQCLEILSTQSENKTLGKTVGEVKVNVEGGSTFADALKRHLKVFDDLYVNMVHAGEVGGLLDTILVRLAKHIEKAMKLKSRVKSAMVYPTAIIGVAVIVITILMIGSFPFSPKCSPRCPRQGRPSLADSVGDRCQRLHGVLHRIHCGGPRGLLYALKRYYGTASGRIVSGSLGPSSSYHGGFDPEGLGRKVYAHARHADHEVPIMDGLMITARTSGNRVVEEAILSARQSISGGKTLSDPLSKSDVFPKMVTHMISVGESTGALDAMLGKIADFYDDEVDQAVETLTSLLEPMMMVFLGTVIGFIVVAMYLPIFKMASVIGS